MKYIIDNNSSKLRSIIEIYLNNMSSEFALVQHIEVKYDRNDSSYNINVHFNKELAVIIGPNFSSERLKILRKLNNEFLNMFGKEISARWYTHIDF